jgi:hypothetical protein
MAMGSHPFGGQKSMTFRFPLAPPKKKKKV